MGPLEKKGGIWYGPKGSYWSNIEKSKNESYLNDLNILGSFYTVKKYFPQHEDIFSLKRMGGVATLEFAENETILDAGCMWGSLSVPLAKTKAQVFAVDQTKESLLLLARRKKEENLDNLHLICGDLNKLGFKDNIFDKVIVNGVLEWIPENSDVEVSHFIKRKGKLLDNLRLFMKDHSKGKSPVEKQKIFLKKVNSALKDDGILFLAIENRYDFLYFFGVREPHCGIRYISLLPRGLQNVFSLLLRGRKFQNWTYSRKGLIKLLQSAGFNKFNFFYGFPDYRMPEFVLTDNGMEFFRKYFQKKNKPIHERIILELIETLIYKKLKLTLFAPSFIVHVQK